jgi:ABC-type proline/glycine betaine transport system substrate-binding protein
MPPYEAEVAIANLVKGWIKARLDRLKEWVDRNLQQEVLVNLFVLLFLY